MAVDQIRALISSLVTRVCFVIFQQLLSVNILISISLVINRVQDIESGELQ